MAVPDATILSLFTVMLPVFPPMLVVLLNTPDLIDVPEAIVRAVEESIMLVPEATILSALVVILAVFVFIKFNCITPEATENAPSAAVVACVVPSGNIIPETLSALPLILPSGSKYATTVSETFFHSCKFAL